MQRLAASRRQAGLRRTVPLPSVCVEALRRHRARQDLGRSVAEPYWDEQRLVFCSTTAHPGSPGYRRQRVFWDKRPFVRSA